MAYSHFYQVTLRQLLNSEAMAEAQILYGEDLLDRPVVQVIASITPPPRPGSLVVTRAELLSQKEELVIRDPAAIVVIRPINAELSGTESMRSIEEIPAGMTVTSVPTTQSTVSASPQVLPLSPEISIKKLVTLCQEAQTPLIAIPGFGEPGQIADDIRMTFLRELKLNSTRLHSSLLSLVLEDGVEALVEEVSNATDRPCALETQDFKVLAARNMGATPLSQQRILTEEALNLLKRQRNERVSQLKRNLCLTPIRIGRRFVLPIFLDEGIAGYISTMVRPADDLESISEILRPAALAALVDFSHRDKGGSNLTVTQKSLLTDILSGRTLSAADQERLERHYGFDLSDGIAVFAVELGNQGTSQSTAAFRASLCPDDQFISTEVEGTRVIVVPCHNKVERTWQEEAQEVIQKLKNRKEVVPNLRVQLGAARLVETVLDLSDAYRQARQALIIGSMIHGEKEFVIGYGELGVKRLLYLIIDHPELDRFYEENLAPLEAYDSEWESELVPSLRIYLEHGANLNSAARALYVHRHTLRYRLEQIAEILKVDIDSQEVILNLQIAFLIKDMKSDGKEKLRA